jgi:glycosyltransferase involved in cell wall biosynthesis
LYKGEKFIQGYIEDVLAQSIFKDIEFIFLDCNSPENEKDFIIPLTKEYSNIKYHRLDNDPGLYAAWNIVCIKI